MEGHNSLIQFVLSVLCLCSPLHFVAGAELRCYEGSLENYTVFSLDDPVALLDSSCYCADRDTVIYAFGFTETSTGDSVSELLGTYLESGNVNTILLNWEEENVLKSLIEPLGIGVISYTYAVSNTIKVGKALGESIVKLHEAGLSLTRLHLIGFSLGAQLMAYCGEEVKNFGYIVERITGCDPARPLYDSSLTLISLNNLGAGNATFVDVIHTDPGVFGTVEAIADIDVWPNYGETQPGCESGLITLLGDTCNHGRCWLYYAETVRANKSFVARLAEDYYSWKCGTASDETIYLGDNINKHATRGNYYLRTNSTSPYGLGINGSLPFN